MSQAIKARVVGKVQGVCFRICTQTEALRLGLSGWVRNTLDGDVDLEAEGSEKSLELFVAWLHRGPIHAIVEQVIVESIESTGTYRGFDIRH